MVFNNSIGANVTNSTFSDIHHGGTQINGPQINHFYDSASPFENFCRRRLSGATFNSSERDPAPKCLPNTRAGIREIIGQWCSGTHDRPICWLTGPAGSGKSAIAQTIAETCDEDSDLAGSFFFSYRIANSNKIAGFVPTIAYQLAISVPSTKASMERALQLDPSIPDQTCQHQFKKLIIDPLLTLGERGFPKIIVVDALDECEGESIVKGFIALLADAYKEDRFNFPLRFFLTSRTDEHIQGLHSTIQNRIYFLGLEEFDAHDDIRTFFESRLSMIYARNYRGMRDIPAPPSHSDLERLVMKSSGLFVLASAIVKFVNDGSDLPHLRLQTALEKNWSDDHTSTRSQQPRPTDSKHPTDLVAKTPKTSTVHSPVLAEEIIRRSVPLDPSRYTITNVRFKNLAVLPDSHHESQVVARAGHDNSSEMWNITLLSNGNYAVKSHNHNNFASCSSHVTKGDSICGRARNQQWRIRETRTRGHYTISLTDSELFWGLTDGEVNTPLTLGSVPNDPKNQWFFTKATAL